MILLLYDLLSSWNTDILSLNINVSDLYVLILNSTVVNITHFILYEQAVASPVLRGMLKQANRSNRWRSISIFGVPHDAVRVFIRYLYSSWYVWSLYKPQNHQNVCLLDRRARLDNILWNYICSNYMSLLDFYMQIHPFIADMQILRNFNRYGSGEFHTNKTE